LLVGKKGKKQLENWHFKPHLSMHFVYFFTKTCTYVSIFIFLPWIEVRMKVETRGLLLSYIAYPNYFLFFLYKRLKLWKTSFSWKNIAFFIIFLFFFTKTCTYVSIFIFLPWIDMRMKVETRGLLLSYIAYPNYFSFFLYKRLKLGKTSFSWKNIVFFIIFLVFFTKTCTYVSIFIFLPWIEV